MSFIQQTALYGWMRRAECHWWGRGALRNLLTGMFPLMGGRKGQGMLA